MLVPCLRGDLNAHRSSRVSIAQGRKLRRSKNEPQIGNVDEGIVERGEDTGNTKNELACTRLLESSMHKIRITSNIPSPARGPRETFSLAAVVVFLGGILGVLVVGWNMEQEKK